MVKPGMADDDDENDDVDPNSKNPRLVQYFERNKIRTGQRWGVYGGTASENAQLSMTLVNTKMCNVGSLFCKRNVDLSNETHVRQGMMFVDDYGNSVRVHMKQQLDYDDAGQVVRKRVQLYCPFIVVDNTNLNLQISTNRLTFVPGGKRVMFMPQRSFEGEDPMMRELRILNQKPRDYLYFSTPSCDTWSRGLDLQELDERMDALVDEHVRNVRRRRKRGAEDTVDEEKLEQEAAEEDDALREREVFKRIKVPAALYYGHPDTNGGPSSAFATEVVARVEPFIEDRLQDEGEGVPLPPMSYPAQLDATLVGAQRLGTTVISLTPTVQIVNNLSCGLAVRPTAGSPPFFVPAQQSIPYHQVNDPDLQHIQEMRPVTELAFVPVTLGDPTFNRWEWSGKIDIRQGGDFFMAFHNTNCNRRLMSRVRIDSDGPLHRIIFDVQDPIAAPLKVLNRTTQCSIRYAQRSFVFGDDALQSAATGLLATATAGDGDEPQYDTRDLIVEGSDDDDDEEEEDNDGRAIDESDAKQNGLTTKKKKRNFKTLAELQKIKASASFGGIRAHDWETLHARSALVPFAWVDPLSYHGSRLRGVYHQSPQVVSVKIFGADEVQQIDVDMERARVGMAQHVRFEGSQPDVIVFTQYERSSDSVVLIVSDYRIGRPKPGPLFDERNLRHLYHLLEDNDQDSEYSAMTDRSSMSTDRSGYSTSTTSSSWSGSSTERSTSSWSSSSSATNTARSDNDNKDATARSNKPVGPLAGTAAARTLFHELPADHVSDLSELMVRVSSLDNLHFPDPNSGIVYVVSFGPHTFKAHWLRRPQGMSASEAEEAQSVMNAHKFSFDRNHPDGARLFDTVYLDIYERNIRFGTRLRYTATIRHVRKLTRTRRTVKVRVAVHNATVHNLTKEGRVRSTKPADQVRLYGGSVLFTLKCTRLRTPGKSVISHVRVDAQRMMLRLVDASASAVWDSVNIRKGVSITDAMRMHEFAMLAALDFRFGLLHTQSHWKVKTSMYGVQLSKAAAQGQPRAVMLQSPAMFALPLVAAEDDPDYAPFLSLSMLFDALSSNKKVEENAGQTQEEQESNENHSDDDEDDDEEEKDGKRKNPWDSSAAANTGPGQPWFVDKLKVRTREGWVQVDPKFIIRLRRFLRTLDPFSALPESQRNKSRPVVIREVRVTPLRLHVSTDKSRQGRTLRARTCTPSLLTRSTDDSLGGGQMANRTVPLDVAGRFSSQVRLPPSAHPAHPVLERVFELMLGHYRDGVVSDYAKGGKGAQLRALLGWDEVMPQLPALSKEFAASVPRRTFLEQQEALFAAGVPEEDDNN
eukprot:TRINITY_DN60306_c0_g1_i1.p1 TRINITY_DN60306_c0_g1~~TRINITY_DN60306_c0_g1_i1.p1  ORF type:complete len:1315 (-),score=704.24 TRINITY_DN60306_c0_g1_i1:49-3993(-)